MITYRSIRIAAILPLAFVLNGVSIIAQADNHNPPHKSFLHRHRHLATAAAGVGGYEVAKHSHRGILHRHPYLTGAAAAAAAHHHYKKQ